MGEERVLCLHRAYTYTYNDADAMQCNVMRHDAKRNHASVRVEEEEDIHFE